MACWLQSAPWVEKYRPQRIDDIVHQEEIIANLRKTMDQPANLTHLLFYGPPGVPLRPRGFLPGAASNHLLLPNVLPY